MGRKRPAGPTEVNSATLAPGRTPPMKAPMTNKPTLRAKLRAERRAHVAALPASTRALILLRPPAPLAARVPEGATVGLYHASAHEAPTLGYARWFYENGRTLALPWFAGADAPMQFRAWQDPFELSDLEPGPWGQLQPAAGAAEVSPDAVFVPLIGFTSDGHRLGQGGGHYDRWLAANPAVTAIGLAWDVQHVDALPHEPHDQRLAAVVTPTRIYEGAA